MGTPSVVSLPRYMALLLVLVAIPARAQSTELGMLLGLTPSAALDRQAEELDEVSLEGGVTFTISATQFLNEHWGFAGEWGQHFSGFGIETAGTPSTLYDVSIGVFHGYAIYRFGVADAKARPFAFGGAGIKYFSARDLETETKLSFGLGGGLSYFVSRNLAIEGRFTYKPTMMDDSDAGDFCDPFGFCQSTLQQIEVMGGVRFRF
jgi:opacity protein-like surface antigen